MRFEALAPDEYLVPPANLFVRNHAATPTIDEKTWKLSIEGSGVEQPLTLSYDELLKLPSKQDADGCFVIDDKDAIRR